MCMSKGQPLGHPRVCLFPSSTQHQTTRPSPHPARRTHSPPRPAPAPQVTPIVSTNCLSAGEALRLIDQGHLIKNDFVLCSADIVSNMALAPMLEAHRARRAADKNAIMTLVGLKRDVSARIYQRNVFGGPRSVPFQVYEPWRVMRPGYGVLLRWAVSSVAVAVP